MRITTSCYHWLTLELLYSGEGSNDGMETVSPTLSLLTQALWPSLLPREPELNICSPTQQGNVTEASTLGTEHVQRECFRNTNYQDRVKQQISNNQINRRLSCVGFFGKQR